MGSRHQDRRSGSRRSGSTPWPSSRPARTSRWSRRSGPTPGPHFGRLGRGEGRSWPDDTPWVARAHGRETTYQVDLATRDEVAAALRELAERVIEDLAKEGRAAIRVHLKVRFAPFFTHTKVRKLAGPTMDPAVVADTALALFDALADDRPVRLLGVRAEMVPPEGGY